MTTPKQIRNSHSPSVAPPSGRDCGPYSAHYTAKGDYSGWILLLVILVVLGGVAIGAATFLAFSRPREEPSP